MDWKMSEGDSTMLWICFSKVWDEHQDAEIQQEKGLLVKQTFSRD
jgi:hypothetical protein